MKFFTGFFSAFTNCFRSFPIIFNKGLWPFLIYPLAIWFFTWLLTLLGVAVFANVVSQHITNLFDFQNIPESGHWLSFAKPFFTEGYFTFILMWLIKIMLFFITGTFSKYLLLIVLSPLFALLSEKTDELLTGNKFSFSFTQLLKDIGRGVVVSLRNMTFEYLFIIGGFIVTLIFPPLLIVTGPLLLFVSWYYTGFTMIDYNSERHKLNTSQSVSFARKNKGYICGVGCVYWIWMLLPTFLGDVAGLMFGPATVVVGATLTFIQINKDKS